MYSTTPAAASGNPAAGLISLILGAYLMYVLLYVAVAIVSAYISYRIIKAAVRNGTIEALKRTGVADALTSAPYGAGGASGGSNYGAPLPPAAEYRR